ncbi:MAG TPA: hypothetical protein VKV05_11565 [Terriglobales bacterium]|nr:hypothetical protein [Terriglobales bacterium]
MRRFASVAALVVVLAAIGFAQTSMTPALQNAPARKSPASEYAGAWIATLQGHVWLTIRLTEQGNGLAGTVQHQNDIQFNDNGYIKSVGEKQVSGTVQTAVLTGDGLLLTVKDAGSQQTDRYLMRLLGADVAEVRMVAMSMPPGMPKPQPWRLTKVLPNAVNPVR